MGNVVRGEELRVELGGTIVVREDGGRAVASPLTTDEVAAVLRLCSAKGLRVEIAGAGTKREWGGVVESDLILETSGLRGVREHSWQDLTATVGAGTPWAEMQRVLAAHGQMVALDPLWEERATVGGVLATNDSGAWRLRYGSARDLVIGMTIVLADGTIAKTGGKVVKNVAGYDLHKLMIGAFGTLGVITEVTFRLHPLPKHVQTFTVSAVQAQQLQELVASIRKSYLPAQALQVRGSSGDFHLDIQLNADPDATYHEALRELLQTDGHLLQNSTCDVWNARELLFKEDATVVKRCVVPSEVCVSADHTEWASAQVEVSSVYQADGSGFVGMRGDLLKIGELIVALQEHAQTTNVHVTVMVTKDETLHRLGRLPGAFPLMREIKQRFDPERVLNRGAIGGV